MILIIAIICACAAVFALFVVLAFRAGRSGGFRLMWHKEAALPAEETSAEEQVEEQQFEEQTVTDGPAADEAAPETEDIPVILAGTVRSTLRPRGLVDVSGLIEPAWWDSHEPGPARDSRVAVSRAPDGLGWLARPLPAPADESGGPPPPLSEVPAK